LIYTFTTSSGVEHSQVEELSFLHYDVTQSLTLVYIHDGGNARSSGFEPLEDITGVGKAYSQNEPGAREKLLSLAYSLAAAVELPSETIQRMSWAEANYPRAWSKGEIPLT